VVTMDGAFHQAEVMVVVVMMIMKMMMLFSSP
jgi:hypothetical protein